MGKFKLPTEVKKYLEEAVIIKKENLFEDMLSYCKYNNITMGELIKEMTGYNNMYNIIYKKLETEIAVNLKKSRENG
jgi:hypothetical protein